MALSLKLRSSTSVITDADLVQYGKRLKLIPAAMPDGDPETRYTVRTLTRDDIDDITARVAKECTRIEFVIGRGQEDQLDEKRMRRELGPAYLDFVLEDWSGVEDEKTGQPIPCIPAHKRALESTRQDALVAFARDNAQRKAAVQQESFRETEDVR